MQTNIILPAKIKVGYQHRSDTYTNTLAYVIYYDNKGVLRKEKSWNGWRDEKLEPHDFENVPTEGFVLNKKAGGYAYSSWDARQTTCRVYDPRGFEFEIGIDNLLYVLENTNSIKGKGLEGSFVYGWSGTQLLLIPTDSVDYKEMTEYNVSLKKSVIKKDMVPGCIYLNKQNVKLIYLGYFDEYTTSDITSVYNRQTQRYDYTYIGYKSKGKKHWFKKLEGTRKTDKFYDITIYSSLSSLLKKDNDQMVSNFADLMDELEHFPQYCPYDNDQFIYEDLTDYSKFRDYDNYLEVNGKFIRVAISQTNSSWDGTRYVCKYYVSYTDRHDGRYNYDKIDSLIFSTREEIFNHYKFKKQIKVLKNGKIAE